ncbi:MAG: tRNA (cytidine/uridine-2'-O-)-methyltransferase [Gammaproteobacteria bacterium]|nr:MAG: tRNA (cytidine/uridine-2'-O-)-methyltransferase [Gammaproteobacteria bacterium]TND06423.1 MAG: tRNA (cytidine/uridine-2'-O-)-methyltransferase [Gammaproteobacteria bacterium]
MFHIVLYQPEIPPNTGNIIRLCANSGSDLHLIRPLGFDLDDSKLRRAGLDYHEFARIHEHDSLDACVTTIKPNRLFGCSTKGKVCYTDVEFQPDDALLFGPETRGLPAEVLAQLPQSQVLRIPMQPHSRSLNLSNAVAIVLYEAWRQQGFK